MKTKLLLFILFIGIKLMAQNCDAPDELFRKRHTIDGMTWGHPYTTFDRHNNLLLDMLAQRM